MPNWCVTDIEVSGKKDELSKLYDLINTWGSKSLDGDSNEDYCFFRFKDVVELTDIVKYAEIFTEDKLNSLSIRGNLEDMQIQNDGSLLIRVSSPWNPMLLMWVRIFDKYLTDYTMYYMSEESGEDIYITNNLSTLVHIILMLKIMIVWKKNLAKAMCLKPKVMFPKNESLKFCRIFSNQSQMILMS